MNSKEQSETPNRRSPASGGYAALDYEQWEKQGGDTEGITRTICHECDRMWPMEAMTEDARFDNICPRCHLPSGERQWLPLHSNAGRTRRDSRRDGTKNT